MDLLHALEWKRFEELCERYWSHKGYQSRPTSIGADGGIDVVIDDGSNPEGVFAVAQCKAWTKPVGVEPVRALWGSKDHFKATLALFYGLSGFTEAAAAFARGKNLSLIDGKELLRQILALPQADQAALLAHITRGDYTTPSCPQCDVKLVYRQGKSGKADFWGCRNYPRCRALIPIRA